MLALVLELGVWLDLVLEVWLHIGTRFTVQPVGHILVLAGLRGRVCAAPTQCALLFE